MAVERRKNLYGFEQRDVDRRRNEDRKTHDIKQLWQRSHEVLRLSLLGYKETEIAQMLGVHKQTVSNTINSEIGMAKLSELRAMRDLDSIDVAKEVAKLFPKAIETYKAIFENPNSSEKLKKEAADTILMDLGGYRAPQKVQGQFAHAHASLEELEEIKKRGRAAAAAAGMLVTGVDQGDSEE